MRFALMATTSDGIRLSAAWQDKGGGEYVLVGSADIIRRADRLVKHKRIVRGNGSRAVQLPASLDEAYVAYLTLIEAFRETGVVSGPIDFAGEDDDGVSLSFIPAPESSH